MNKHQRQLPAWWPELETLLNRYEHLGIAISGLSMADAYGLLCYLRRIDAERG